MDIYQIDRIIAISLGIVLVMFIIKYANGREIFAHSNFKKMVSKYSCFIKKNSVANKVIYYFMPLLIILFSILINIYQISSIMKYLSGHESVLKFSSEVDFNDLGNILIYILKKLPTNISSINSLYNYYTYSLVFYLIPLVFIIITRSRRNIDYIFMLLFEIVIIFITIKVFKADNKDFVIIKGVISSISRVLGIYFATFLYILLLSKIKRSKHVNLKYSMILIEKNKIMVFVVLLFADIITNLFVYINYFDYKIVNNYPYTFMVLNIIITFIVLLIIPIIIFTRTKSIREITMKLWDTSFKVFSSIMIITIIYMVVNYVFNSVIIETEYMNISSIILSYSKRIIKLPLAVFTFIFINRHVAKLITNKEI